jgi:nicotinamidase-related amidase
MNEKIDPKRALIVIDVQNDYDGGALPIEYPPFSETIVNVAKAMDAAKTGNVKIVMVKMLAPETGNVFAKGTRGAQLHEMVRDRAYDHYIEKDMPSAFTGTNLELWLRTNKIDTVTIAGYMTHNCDLSTIIHAVHMGFAVEFLSDATGSLPYHNLAGHASAEEIHRVMTVVFQSRFAAVTTTEKWIDALKTGEALPRDNPYASNQAALKTAKMAA